MSCCTLTKDKGSDEEEEASTEMGRAAYTRRSSSEVHSAKRVRSRKRQAGSARGPAWQTHISVMVVLDEVTLQFAVTNTLRP
jgi:hypothetical protein